MVALLIATIKGTLVVLFFMHLRYSPKLTMAAVIAVDVLVVHHVFADHDGLPVAWLGDLRRAVTKIVGGQIIGYQVSRVRYQVSGLKSQFARVGFFAAEILLD